MPVCDETGMLAAACWVVGRICEPVDDDLHWGVRFPVAGSVHWQ